MTPIAEIVIEQNSFQTLWYFTLLALTLAAVIIACLRYAITGIVALWAEGNRSPAAVLAAACLSVVALCVAMTVNAALGLGGAHS